MNIVLDTNAFYAYIGPDNLGWPLCPKIKYKRLNTLLSNTSNYTMISSVSLYEFFVKFDDNPEIIKNGLNFLKRHIKSIINVHTLRINNEEINDILMLSNECIKIRIKEVQR